MLMSRDKMFYSRLLFLSGYEAAVTFQIECVKMHAVGGMVQCAASLSPVQTHKGKTTVVIVPERTILSTGIDISELVKWFCRDACKLFKSISNYFKLYCVNCKSSIVCSAPTH